jgi:hypothetical protein
VLFLLRDAGQAARVPADPPGTVRVICGGVLLHALDFWLRNPDYLATNCSTRWMRVGSMPHT